MFKQSNTHRLGMSFFALSFTLSFGVSSGCYADPTRPPVNVQSISKQRPENTTPILQAIYYNEQQPKAILNGRVYLESQVIDKIKVIQIRQNAVDIEYERNGKLIMDTLSVSNASFIRKAVEQ